MQLLLLAHLHVEFGFACAALCGSEHEAEHETNEPGGPPGGKPGCYDPLACWSESKGCCMQFQLKLHENKQEQSSRMWEFTFNLKTGETTRRSVSDHTGCDFPQGDPSKIGRV